MEKSSSAGPVVEARLSWGRDLLAVKHRRADMAVSIQDFDLPGGFDATLVVAENGELLLPTGAPVPAGQALKLRHGRATLRLALVPDDAPSIPRVSRARMASAAALVLCIVNLFVFAFLSEQRRAAPRPAAEVTLPPPPVALDLGGLREPVDQIAPVTEASKVPCAVVEAPVPRRVQPAPPDRYGVLAIIAANPPRPRSLFDREIDVEATNRLFTPTIDAVALPLSTRTSL